VRLNYRLQEVTGYTKQGEIDYDNLSPLAPSKGTNVQTVQYCMIFVVPQQVPQQGFYNKCILVYSVV
jgi:hypothetical protein